MRHLPLLLVAALAAAPAGAQAPRIRQAFEPAVIPWVGFRGFGDRVSSTAQEGSAGYGSSAALGVSLDVPLTRRTGFMADVHIAPRASQRLESPNGVSLYDDVVAFGASAGFAGRLRPHVPVFFFGGAGVVALNKKPVPEVEGSQVEPAGVFAIGYDGMRGSRWGWRATYHGYVTKPAEIEVENSETKSLAYDWSFGFGIRYAFRRAPAPAGGAR